MTTSGPSLRLDLLTKKTEPEPPLRLYHYTSTFHLPMILSMGGLSRGDVPISPYRSENAVWFTTDSLPLPDRSHGLSGSIVNKREVQIAVDFSIDDPALVKWTRFARIKKIDKVWLKALHDTAGGQSISNTWWLYRGVISPERFASVKFLRDSAYTDVSRQESARV